MWAISVPSRGYICFDRHQVVLFNFLNLFNVSSNLRLDVFVFVQNNPLIYANAKLALFYDWIVGEAHDL